MMSVEIGFYHYHPNDGLPDELRVIGNIIIESRWDMRYSSSSRWHIIIGDGEFVVDSKDMEEGWVILKRHKRDTLDEMETKFKEHLGDPKSLVKLKEFLETYDE